MTGTQEGHLIWTGKSFVVWVGFSSVYDLREISDDHALKMLSVPYCSNFRVLMWPEHFSSDRFPAVLYKISLSEIYFGNPMAYRGLWRRIIETPRETGPSVRLSRALWSWGLNISCERVHHFWATCSKIWLFLWQRIFFSYPDRISCEASCARCLLSCHCASWMHMTSVKRMSRLLYDYLWSVGRLWLDPPWAFSSPGWKTPVPSTFLHLSSLSTSDHLGGPPLDNFQFFRV